MFIKKETYSEHWLKQGLYGEIRIARMLTRKLNRHYKKVEKTRGRFKRINGQLHQICDYQPNGGTAYCEYPCNGDC